MAYYRAVISNSGRAPLPELVHLRKCLVQQFTHSPFCSSIFIEKSESDGSVDKLIDLLPTKSRGFSHVSELHKGTADTLVVQLSDQSCLSEYGSGNHITSWNFVQSIRTPFLNSAQTQIIERLKAESMGSRISAYRYGRLVLPETAQQELYPGTFNAKPIMDAAYGIYAQFLSNRYRGILTEHLAQAIRLNYETCIPDEVLPGNVEEVNFNDCMKIIGLEDRI